MENNYECITIIEDDEPQETNKNNDGEKMILKKINSSVLKKWYIEDKDIYEIGVDEVGRGPLFGRVYTAAVILPKDDNFNYLFLCMLNVIICIAVATEISLDVGKHSSSRDITILWRTN
jgi:hypothetical protein